MFLRLILKSLNGNKAKLLAGFSALFLASLLMSALLTVVLDLDESLGKGLRGFGANYVLKANRQPLTVAQLKKIKKPPLAEFILTYAPFAEITLKKGFKSYKLIGTDIKSLKKLSPWLNIDDLHLKENEILAGKDVARHLSLSQNDSFDGTGYTSSKPKVLQKTNCVDCHKKSLSADHRGRLSAQPRASECLGCHESHEKRKRFKHRFVIAGFVSSGGDEDGWFFTNSDTVFKLSRDKGFSNVGLSVLTAKISEKALSRIILKSFPDAKLTNVKRISEAEKGLLSKIKLLMTLLTLIVLLTCSLSVTSTLTGIIMERQTEIGLMKALGAGSGNIIAVFATEMIVVAFMAGLLGYFGGFGLALLLAKVVFSTKVAASFLIAIAGVVTSLFLTLITGIGPIKKALRIEPVLILRGE